MSPGTGGLSTSVEKQQRNFKCVLSGFFAIEEVDIGRSVLSILVLSVFSCGVLEANGVSNVFSNLGSFLGCATEAVVMGIDEGIEEDVSCLSDVTERNGD